MDFKVPSLIPQDLQLIQDIVGVPPIPSHQSERLAANHKHDEDSILSSDEDDAASEKEVEADILGVPDDEDSGADMYAQYLHLFERLIHADISSAPLSENTSDSDPMSSSDSDSEDELPSYVPKSKLENILLEDDDEGGGAITSPDQVKTKNEIADVNVVIPEVEEVGEHEILEQVGEVLSILDKVVIVKGTASLFQNRAADRALDSETLLVFEDRKVLGYVSAT